MSVPVENPFKKWLLGSILALLLVGTCTPAANAAGYRHHRRHHHRHHR